MKEDAVICIKCGFNKKLGKRLKIVFESTMNATAITDSPATSSVNITPSTLPEKSVNATKNAAKVSMKLTPEQQERFINYILPISFFVLAIIVAAIKGSAIGVVLNLISIILQTVFMLISMAIAAKIGEFGFGELKTAILKVIGICSAVVVVDLLIPYISFIVALVVVIGLLKISFELDFFELFLIIGTMAIVRLFILMIILNAIMSLIR